MAASVDEDGLRAWPETRYRVPGSPWEQLGCQPSAVSTDGPLRSVADRVLAYVRANQVGTVLPLLSPDHGGLVISAGGETGFGTALKALRSERSALPFLLDPAYYEKNVATVERPFILPEGRLTEATLSDVCDDQLAAGAALAMTSSGYIPADGTDVLKEILEQAVALDRADVVTVLPLDISMLDRGYFPQTLDLLTQAGIPIAVILGRQFDPLEQSSHIVPNLRLLAAAVPLLALRTDLNAFDLVAHGAVAGSIGIAGSTRHTIEPNEAPHFARSNDRSPHLLVSGLGCWWKGSKLIELVGAQPQYAPRCDCAVCDGRLLTRFTGRNKGDTAEALGHDVATWTRIAAELLSAETIKSRAEQWTHTCQTWVENHRALSSQLNRIEQIKPQKSLRQWATLTPWPSADAPTSA